MMASSKILIVDDEDDFRNMLESLISAQGHFVVTANNGQTGIDRIIKDNSIATVISDINMPEMGGFEMLAKIRSIGKNIPVIFLTGSYSNTVTQAKQLGALELFHKPIQFEVLNYTLERALKLGKALEQVELELGCNGNKTEHSY